LEFKSVAAKSDLGAARACGEGWADSPDAVLSCSQGVVEAVAVDASGTVLAVCVANGVRILELPSGASLFHVEGHTAVVTAVAFCPHVPHLLVTAAEDRTFKVSRTRSGRVG
jgi:WD40 repeat protein